MRRLLSCLVLTTLLLIASNCGSRKYTIDDVTQVLYEAGLLPTRHLTITVDPEVIRRTGGIETYRFTIEGPDLSSTHRAEITIFPSQRLRKQVQQEYAEISEALEMVGDVFAKGNVMLVVDPALPETEAEKYRRALESLN
jgi:hypothetical protein